MADENKRNNQEKTKQDRQNKRDTKTTGDKNKKIQINKQTKPK